MNEMDNQPSSEKPIQDETENLEKSVIDTGKEDAGNVPATVDFYTELQKEFNEKGEISEEFKQGLKEKGINEERLNSYIEGFEAKKKVEQLEANKILEDIYNSVGGEKVLNEIKAWASNSLTKEEIDSINNIQDPLVMKMVYGSLKNRMNESLGSVPNLISGNGGTSDANYFKSKAQMLEAISNPRYAKDPAYRGEVSRKISASYAHGINLSI